MSQGRDINKILYHREPADKLRFAPRRAATLITELDKRNALAGEALLKDTLNHLTLLIPYKITHDAYLSLRNSLLSNILYHSKLLGPLELATKSRQEISNLLGSTLDRWIREGWQIHIKKLDTFSISQELYRQAEYTALRDRFTSQADLTPWVEQLTDFDSWSYSHLIHFLQDNQDEIDQFRDLFIYYLVKMALVRPIWGEKGSYNYSLNDYEKLLAADLSLVKLESKWIYEEPRVSSYHRSRFRTRPLRLHLSFNKTKTLCQKLITQQIIPSLRGSWEYWQGQNSICEGCAKDQNRMPHSALIEIRESPDWSALGEVNYTLLESSLAGWLDKNTDPWFEKSKDTLGLMEVNKEEWYNLQRDLAQEHNKQIRSFLSEALLNRDNIWQVLIGKAPLEKLTKEENLPIPPKKDLALLLSNYSVNKESKNERMQIVSRQASLLLKEML